MNQERIEQVLEDNRNVLEEVYVPRAPLRFRQRFMVEMAIGDGVGPWSILSRQITNEVNLVIQLPRRPTLPPGTELVPTWAKRTSSVLFECPLCYAEGMTSIYVCGGCSRRVACTECTFRMVGIEICVDFREKLSETSRCQKSRTTPLDHPLEEELVSMKPCRNTTIHPKPSTHSVVLD